MTRLALALLAAALFAPSAAAGAAPPLVAQFGSVAPVGREDNDQNWSSVQTHTAPGTPSYEIPYGGRITEWRFQGRTRPDGDQPRAADVQLQLWRPGPRGQWTLVAESALQTAPPYVLSHFSTSIPVRAGDHLGLSATTGSAAFTGDPRDRFAEWDFHVPIGAIAFPDAFYDVRRLNVSATVERCATKQGKPKNPRACFRR